MISSIEWIPAGVANPNPQKYEMSATEQEMLNLMMTQSKDGPDTPVLASAVAAALEGRSKSARQSSSKSKTTTTTSHDLPADLRMDEYSSDDDDDDVDSSNDRTNCARVAALSQLLVGSDLINDDDDVDDDDKLEQQQNEDDVVVEEDDDEMEHHKADIDTARQRNRRAPRTRDDEEDDDDDEDDWEDIPDTREYEPIDVEGLKAMGLSNVGMMNDDSAGGDGQYRVNGDDGLDQNDDNDSEAEDVAISAHDALLVLAKAEDDFASLEVYVYDQKNGNLFVHHDIPLPAFPLCLAHGQVSRDATTGNFCAVGTFSPGIEIWNLDVLNALEPSCILGGDDTSIADDLMKLQIMNAANAATTTNNKNGSGKKIPQTTKQKLPRGTQSGLKPGSHTDAVMALSWNTIHKQVIASGSADGTVKLWDITKAGSNHNEANAATFTHHKDKVQSVAWNPNEGTLLASGSYDRTVALLDARGDGSNSNVKSIQIAADCEAIAWDPFHPECLTVVSEDGTMACWDVRKFETSTPLWSFVANEYGGVTDLSYNSKVPGMMVTCSVDKTVTLWDAQNVPSNSGYLSPRSCGSKDMCAGKLYAVGFYPSSPWLLGCGGSGNQLSIWDLSSEEAIQNRFQSRLNGGSMPHDAAKTPAAANFQDTVLPIDKATSLSNSVAKKTRKPRAKRKAHKKS